jgi:hypothetical protein
MVLIGIDPYPTVAIIDSHSWSYPHLHLVVGEPDMLVNRTCSPSVSTKNFSQLSHLPHLSSVVVGMLCIHQRNDEPDGLQEGRQALPAMLADASAAEGRT